jgi:hypothetical protein
MLPLLALLQLKVVALPDPLKNYDIYISSQITSNHVPIRVTRIVSAPTPTSIIAATILAQLNTIKKAFDPPVWLYPFMINNIRDADHNVHLLV